MTTAQIWSISQGFWPNLDTGKLLTSHIGNVQLQGDMSIQFEVLLSSMIRFILFEKATSQRPNSPARWLREQHLNGESSALQQWWFHSWVMDVEFHSQMKIEVWHPYTICISAQVFWNMFQLMNLWTACGSSRLMSLFVKKSFENQSFKFLRLGIMA